MNIIKKLTFRHLLKNKGRTIITTLGICVSVAMITAVFVSAASFLNFFGEITIFDGGNKHATFYDLNSEQVKTLERDDRIESVGTYFYGSPEENGFQLKERISNHTGVGNIGAGNENYFKQMITCELDGEIPKNENEIIIENELIEKNNLNWKIGDTVSIPVGGRYAEEDGKILYISSSNYYGGEKFEQKDIKEFKITGILYGNNPTSSSAKILRGLSNDEKSGTLDANITLKDVNPKAIKTLESIREKIGVDKDSFQINDDYLETKFAFSEGGRMVVTILPVAVLVLIIIMIASVVLIYNAFGMSLSERTRYLGMLGSVGATKQQKKQSVYFEGFILGAIGIPIGIGAGIAGIAITLKAVGDKIISTGMINGVENSDISMHAVVPVWVIAGIVLFSALTIFISAIIPAKKASAITPIEALRQSNEIKLKTRRLKTPKYVRMIFGYEGELAHKNLKRNGRKSRVITVSIAISVILFLTCNTFSSLFIETQKIEEEIPYQIIVRVDAENKDKMFRDLSEISGVDKLYNATVDIYTFGRDTNETDQSLATQDILTKDYKTLFENGMYFYLNVVEDEYFNSLCADNSIDYRNFYGGETKAVILNNINHKSGGAEVFNENILGKELKRKGYSDVELVSFVKYDKDNFLFSLNTSGVVSAYVPESVYFANAADDAECTFAIQTEEHEKVYTEIENLVETEGYDCYINDMIENLDAMNTIIFVLQVFIYGFVSLITLITLANIINTVSTSIALRRKEFAMLKSVGTTMQGFNKMICLESLFYGLRALIVSIPISILIGYFMHSKLGAEIIPFRIDFAMYGGVILAVFVIIGFSMLYSVSKFRNASIIDDLKEDIS